MLVPEVNWGLFNELPGAADENFEKLCRALVRRHYGSSGRFKQLANQPGVEFHLELTESCDLGARHAGLVGNAMVRAGEWTRPGGHAPQQYH